jgi:poly(3-hydroxybutyrate) depolymerase
MSQMKKIILRITLIVLSIPVLLVLVAWTAFMISNRTNGSLISDGLQRRYLLFVPESYEPSTPPPPVISIHGFAEWPAHPQQTSG